MIDLLRVVRPRYSSRAAWSARFGTEGRGAARRVVASTRRLGAGTLVALCALVVAGCGSGDETSASTSAKAKIDAEYAREIKQVDDSLDLAMESLFADQQMTDREIASARTALAQAARDLERLEAPGEVREHHEKYQSGVSGFRPIIDKLAQARGDAEQIGAHLTDPAYADVIADLEAAKRGFEGAGYEL